MADLSTSELSISTRMKHLCEEYSNRPYIVRRGVLPTLVKFLSNPNRQVQLNAAHALRLLGDHPENPEPMCKERGLLQALVSLYQTAEDQNDLELFTLVGDIVTALEAALDRREEHKGVDANNAITESESAMTSKNRGQRIKQSMVARTRSIVLDIPSLTVHSVPDLRDILECIRGVVSFTIDQHSRSIVLYASTPTATLLRLLGEKDFVAVVRSESQPNRTRGGGGGENDEENAHTGYGVPSYLNTSSKHNNNTSQQQQHYDGSNSSEYLRTLVLHGLQNNSLSSRIERQKLERAKRAREKNTTQAGQVSGFFQKITSVLW